MRRIITGVATLLAVSGSFASTSGEDTISFEIPVTLTGSRLPQPIDESAQPVTVLDRELLDMAGVRTVADALRLVPGFVVGYKYGNQPSISYQGIADEAGRRMQILVDNRPIYITATGGAFFQSLPVQIEDIQTIEVIRGPNTAAYGSNAFFATINIITAHAAERAGTEVRARRGSNGIEDYYFQHGGELAGNDYSVSINQHRDQGLGGRYDDRDDKALLLRVDRTLANGDDLLFQAGVAEGQYQAGGTDPLQDPERPLEQKRNFQQLEWRHLSGSQVDLTLNLYHNWFANQHSWVSQPIPGFGDVAWDQDYEVERLGLEAENVLQLDRHRLVVGVGYQHDTIISEAMLYPNTRRKHTADTTQLFFHDEMRWGQGWLANFGAMYEHNTFVSDDVTPHLSLIKRLNTYSTLRLGYSVGTRLPTKYEYQGQQAVTHVASGTVFNPFVANGVYSHQVESEKITAADISYHYINPAYPLMLELRAYYDEVDDLLIRTQRNFFPAVISGLPGGLSWTHLNTDSRIYLSGAELSLDVKPLDHLRLLFNYAYSDVSSNVTDEVYSYNDTAPKHNISMVAEYEFANGLKVGGLYHRVSSMSWSNVDQTTGYEKLDMHVKKCWSGTRKNDTCLALNGINLVGEVNDFREAYAGERQVNLEASFRF